MLSTNHPKIGHNILVIQREKEIILADPKTGQEFASVTLCMMEGDKEVSSGKYETVVTKNFWLQWNPILAETDKALADCYVE